MESHRFMHELEEWCFGHFCRVLGSLRLIREDEMNIMKTVLRLGGMKDYIITLLFVRYGMASTNP